MSVTHLAGAVASYKGRIIQRCAICGEKLADSVNQHTASTVAELPDGTYEVTRGSGELIWREACLVRFDGNHQSDIGLYTEVDKVPDDFCLALVE